MNTPAAPTAAPTSPALADVATRAADDVATAFPVLEAAPDVARMLARLRAADQLIARALDDLIHLQDTGLAEASTGVGPTSWIGIVAKRTSTDTRMLTTAATMLRRLPSLRAAFLSGAVSWAQVRSVCLATHRLPAHLDDAIDDALADTIDADVDADAITHVISQVLATIEASNDPAQPDPAEFLAIQPRLDNSGGRLFGELGPEAWAIADAALNSARPARSSTGSRDATTFGEHDDPADRRRAIRANGKRRLDRLVDILDASLADAQDVATGRGASDDACATDETAAADPGPRTRESTDARAADASESVGRRARPRLILRADLDTLLDRGRTPGALLHQLLGGVVHVDHVTARRLVDERGADLRTVIIEDGRVVGVGRRTRLAPGWLRDATLALHDVCSAPGCAAAARGCDSDHARPWHPVRPGDVAGSTDIDQLAPLCRRDNRRKEQDGWVATQRPDGTRSWRHPRTGLATTTVPATWRPSAWDSVIELAARPPP